MTRALALMMGLSLPLIAACPAAAQNADGRQFSVSMKDLNLNTHDGAAQFLQRLDTAAAKACGPAPDIRELERVDRFKTCVAQTRTVAITRLNNAEVSALARGAAQEAATSPAQPRS